jgi:tRNA U34 2-thiouridine synthase MnmA/TrmU
MKAIMLLSGGLDSRLAMELVLEQRIELHALNHVTAFCTCTRRSSCKHEAAKAAEECAVPISVRNVTEEFLRIIEDPPHGYGSRVNPCIDCRILLMRNARGLMAEVGARFVVTGEVLGERPMSQRREAMELIEREAGLEGLVVRPLCARALQPSVPEEKGWVDRSRFMAITGRRRIPQMELAAKLGVRDYPCPAGGCRLTDPGFAARMRDLLRYDRPLEVNDVQLLRVGRHFRLSRSVKAVVGRDEKENEVLGRLREPEDASLELCDVPGPMTILRGTAGGEETELAGALTARYSKARDLAEVSVSVRCGDKDAPRRIRVRPARDEQIDAMKIEPE